MRREPSALAVSIDFCYVANVAKPIRVLIVDDHPVVRAGIRTCLAHSGFFEVIGEAQNAEGAVNQALLRKPDMILMDFDLPDIDGLLATRQVCQNLPDTKVLLFCMRVDVALEQRVKESGAIGCILKTVTGEELVKKMEVAARGGTAFDTLASEPQPVELLTPREVEILRKLAEGARSKEIAVHYAVSLRTVETHRQHIMNKLKIRNLAGLTRFAIIHGLASFAP